MRRRSSIGFSVSTFLPSMRIWPEVGSIKRLTMRSSVVFPEPEVPTSIQVLPSGTSKVTESTAGLPVPGYLLVISLNSILAMLLKSSRLIMTRISHCMRCNTMIAKFCLRWRRSSARVNCFAHRCRGIFLPDSLLACSWGGRLDNKHLLQSYDKVSAFTLQQMLVMNVDSISRQVCAWRVMPRGPVLLFRLLARR